MNIVLLEPEIPQNTGNIIRTCTVTGARLHLIEPLGFSLDEKNVKRAGMDYVDLSKIKVYKSFDEFLEINNYPIVFMATTKSTKIYCDLKYDIDSYIMFGKESGGIPEEILLNYKETSVRIPMLKDSRSLNLSNAVAVVLYEALRQVEFKTLECQGNLHKYSW